MSCPYAKGAKPRKSTSAKKREDRKAVLPSGWQEAERNRQAIGHPALGQRTQRTAFARLFDCADRFQIEIDVSRLLQYANVLDRTIAHDLEAHLGFEIRRARPAEVAVQLDDDVLQVAGIRKF